MPTDPTPAAMEKAREIARFHAAPTANQPSLTYAIARAIDEARRVPDGHVREGVTDRKCPLPRTGDGVFVMPCMTLHYPRSGVEASVLSVWFDGTLDLQSHTSDGMPINNWKRLRFNGDAYSTQAAAEAARERGGV